MSRDPEAASLSTCPCTSIESDTGPDHSTLKDPRAPSFSPSQNEKELPADGMAKKYFGLSWALGGREGQQAMVDMYKSLLDQVSVELDCMNLLLAHVHETKVEAQNILCKCLSPQWAEGLFRPRTLITVKVPEGLTDVVQQALADPQNPIVANSRGSLNGIKAFSNLLQKLPSSPEPLPRNEYEDELERLLAKAHPNPEERRKAIDDLVGKSLTGYCQSASNMILYVHFKYNFPVLNPLMLLSARWQLLETQERLVRFVDRKRKGSRESSAQRYGEFRRKYAMWKSQTRKLEIEQKCALSEQRQQRRVDIYGREAHELSSSPLIHMMAGSIPESELFDLGMGSLRKESIDYDLDLCTYRFFASI